LLRVTGQRALLRLAQALARLEQRRGQLRLVTRKAVRRPRDDGRLLQCAHL